MLLQNANFPKIAYYGHRMNRPPPLTDEQRRQALIKAAEARRLRAEIKELLKAKKMLNINYLVKVEKALH